MGKVKVVTKCGKEHFFEVDQEVDTVEIVEERQRHILNHDKHFMTVNHPYYLKRGNQFISIFDKDGCEIGWIHFESGLFGNKNKLEVSV